MGRSTGASVFLMREGMPAPMPSAARPSDSSSNAAISAAISVGWRWWGLRMPRPILIYRVATAHAAAPGHAPLPKGFSANQTVEKPARSAATACATHCRGVRPPWQRSARAGRVGLDIPRTGRIAAFREVRVDRLPLAVLFDQHHRRARDERLVDVSSVRLAGLRPPARRRLAMAGHHRHGTPHDHLHVERLPPAAFLVLGVVLPEPAPVLEPDVGVAIHVEEDVGGVGAPDWLQGRPVERSVGAEVAVVGGENGRVVGVGAAVEANGACHAERLARYSGRRWRPSYAASRIFHGRSSSGSAPPWRSRWWIPCSAATPLPWISRRSASGSACIRPSSWASWGRPTRCIPSRPSISAAVGSPRSARRTCRGSGWRCFCPRSAWCRCCAPACGCRFCTRHPRSRRRWRAIFISLPWLYPVRSWSALSTRSTT